MDMNSINYPDTQWRFGAVCNTCLITGIDAVESMTPSAVLGWTAVLQLIQTFVLINLQTWCGTKVVVGACPFFFLQTLYHMWAACPYALSLAYTTV
jgi:hypothetical protein